MQIWQVGLDIQENGFYAIALQKRRYGWQLRHWHVQPMESLSTPSTLPVLSPAMIASLKQWRQQLPKRISVRIALPANAILQQRIPLPDKKLSPQEQSWLVDASLGKLFPLAAKELVIDYRAVNSAAADPAPVDSIVVSAARRTEVMEWINALAQADIYPDIVDTAPCVLRAMAKAAGVAGDRLLFHQLSQHCLVVSPGNHPFLYRLFANNAMDCAERIAYALMVYQQASQQTVTDVSCSGFHDDPALPDNAHIWSPLSAIQQLSAPLPESPHQFVLACGLALRQEDGDASG